MKKNVKSDDLYRLVFVSEPQMSPKGDRIIYVRKRSDKKDRQYYSSLQSINVLTKREYPFTEAGKHSDLMPRISPNGKMVLFLRVKDGEQELRIISLYGGESRILADFPEGEIRDFAFSPDGKQIALLFAKLKEEIPFEKNKRKEPVCRDISRLYYRLDGHGFIDEEPAQLYLLRASGGTLKKISDTHFDIGSFCWSPDSQSIAYTTVDKHDPELHMEEEDIFILEPGKGKLSKLTKPAGPVGLLKFSPDGETLFFSGHFNPNYSWGADNMDLQALDLKSGEIRNLSGSLDRSTDMLTLGDITPSFVRQSPLILDGKIYFTVSSEGTNPLYACELDSGQIETVLEGPECIVSHTASGNGQQFALHIAQAERPDEIWHLDLSEGKRLTRVSFNNDKYLEDLKFHPAQLERMSFKDTNIDVFLQFPPDFDKNKSYPLLLNIHGGPRTQYGYTWFHEMQFFAANGYVVAYSNPRGSQGYGKDFADAITGKWGQPAFDDCMAVVDNLVKRPYIDGKRLYVTGGSYGGYLTNWIVSQTDRFRAAVAQRSISDLGTFFGTSDIGWDLVSEFKATPWEAPEKYAEWSPLSYLKNITTPLMLIHSENDLRCPMEQAERLYAPLKYMGRDVRLVRFPESSHGLSRSGRPDRRIKRLELMLEWFETHA